MKRKPAPLKLHEDKNQIHYFTNTNVAFINEAAEFEVGIGSQAADCAAIRSSEMCFKLARWLDRAGEFLKENGQ